jgi:hypothetical protein
MIEQSGSLDPVGRDQAEVHLRSIFCVLSEGVAKVVNPRAHDFELFETLAELANRPRFTRLLYTACLPAAAVISALVALILCTVPNVSSTYIGSLGLVLVAAFIRRMRKAAGYTAALYPVALSIVAALVLGIVYQGAQSLIFFRLGQFSADNITDAAWVIMPVMTAVLIQATRRGMGFEVPVSVFFPEGTPGDLTNEVKHWFQVNSQPGSHWSWEAATHFGSQPAAGPVPRCRWAGPRRS